MDKQEELMTIERSLWTNDAAIYEATYSPDAILIFPEVGRIGLELALEAIRGRTLRVDIGRKSDLRACP